MGDVRDDEDPVEISSEAERKREHALTIGLDAAVVGCLQIQSVGSASTIGGCRWKNTVLGSSVDEEGDASVVVLESQKAACWRDVRVEQGRCRRLCHLSYCWFPEV